MDTIDALKELCDLLGNYSRFIVKNGDRDNMFWASCCTEKPALYEHGIGMADINMGLRINADHITEVTCVIENDYEATAQINVDLPIQNIMIFAQK